MPPREWDVRIHDMIAALDTPAERSLLYVGCTRALHRLVILADKKARAQLKG